MVFLRFLSTALLVANAILFIYSLYTILIALFSLRPSKDRRNTLLKAHHNMPQKQHRFAILIAARNEGAVIGNLIESLRHQQYPAHLYDVIVVPNNCTDNTKIVAAQAGARILTCRQAVRSKGDVLSQVLPEISQRKMGYDAICVIDADNLVHPGFLGAMNDALLGGATVAQGYRDSKNPHDSAISGSYSIYFWLLNRFYNRSRHNAGLSTPIGGSGFMIQTALVRKMAGMHFATLTEDLELTILCHLAGEKVAWVPKAIVYDEQPLTFRQSWKQRSRWSSGMYQIGALYTRPILKKAWQDRRLRGLDLIALYMSAHMQVLWFATMVINALTGLLQLLNNRTTPAIMMQQTAYFLLVTWLSVTGVAILTILLERKLRIGIVQGMLFFWLFIMSWLPINLCCLFHRTSSWEQIKHERSIRLHDLPS